MISAGKLKSVLSVFLFAAVIFSFWLWALLKPDDAYSNSERRGLAQFPTLSFSTLMSGEFMDQFEDYSLDQFPIRDTFRTIKAKTAYSILRMKDNNGIYFDKNGYVSKLDYPVKEPMLQYAADKFSYIYENYLQGMNIYFSIVPDKNYFMDGLKPDYDDIVDYMLKRTEYMTYIDIFGQLDLSCYYKTDTHWRQEKLIPVADKILTEMGAEPTGDFTENILPLPFYGVYKGQSALDLEPDTITYLTNDDINSAEVTSYNTGAPLPGVVYNMDKASGLDPYEMFLSGGDPLIVIENPNAETDRELIVFRDSFGSSIAPLFIGSYKTVTLVDIRYMPSSALDSFIDFSNQDVLFLYSTLLLNSSLGLR